MVTSPTLNIAIVGCGHAARIHLERLCARLEVRIVGCADPSLEAAEALAARVPADRRNGSELPTFADHLALLQATTPAVLAIFTPPRAHYRPAMDALQAGCHLFIEKPLSTNAQEATDIVHLARGRGLTVGVGHQFRLSPFLQEARRRLEAGAIGSLRLVTATMAQPWLATLGNAQDAWRLDPRVAGGGILADAGDHVLDALLWTTGRAVEEVAAFQERTESGLDLITAAAVRLAGGVPATLALSAVSPGTLFELTFYGDRGRLRATEQTLDQEDGTRSAIPFSTDLTPENIDSDFVQSILNNTAPCCPAEAAIETVRLLEAITRSAATGQNARLS